MGWNALFKFQAEMDGQAKVKFCNFVIFVGNLFDGGGVKGNL